MNRRIAPDRAMRRVRAVLIGVRRSIHLPRPPIVDGAPLCAVSAPLAKHERRTLNVATIKRNCSHVSNLVGCRL